MNDIIDLLEMIKKSNENINEIKITYIPDVHLDVKGTLELFIELSDFIDNEKNPTYKPIYKYYNDSERDLETHNLPLGMYGVSKEVFDDILQEYNMTPITISLHCGNQYKVFDLRD